jgi:hypothetical protein
MVRIIQHHFLPMNAWSANLAGLIDAFPGRFAWHPARLAEGRRVAGFDEIAYALKTMS